MLVGSWDAAPVLAFQPTGEPPRVRTTVRTGFAGSHLQRLRGEIVASLKTCAGEASEQDEGRNRGKRSPLANGDGLLMAETADEAKSVLAGVSSRFDQEKR